MSTEKGAARVRHTGCMRCQRSLVVSVWIRRPPGMTQSLQTRRTLSWFSLPRGCWFFHVSRGEVAISPCCCFCAVFFKTLAGPLLGLLCYQDTLVEILRCSCKFLVSFFRSKAARTEAPLGCSTNPSHNSSHSEVRYRAISMRLE